MSGSSQAMPMPEMSPQELIATIYAMREQMKVMAEALKAAQELQERQAEQLRMINLHLGMMNEARTIEETLQVMSKLGSEALQCDCTVYSIESLGSDMLFTANEENERVYLSLDRKSIIANAIEQKTSLIDNDCHSHTNETAPDLGDQRENRYVSSVMVVPLANQFGDVIGVVVAKDKSDGKENFEQKDAQLFDLENGSLGETFRMGLEKKSLMQEATIDPLTHLMNRNGMNRFLEDVVLPKAKRHEPVSTIVIDIDYFKQYNTLYGHDGGDACLKMVADTLKNNVRMTADSAIIRTGGDEMLLILPVDEARAFEIAERLRHTVEETTLNIGDKTTNVTLTLGVAAYAPENVHILDRNNIVSKYNARGFKAADENLYKAKEAGRNCTYGSDELMKTHRSTPSPTAVLGEFLKSIEYSITKDNNGYILHDDRYHEDVRRDMQTPQEIIAYLETSGVLRDNLLKDLTDDWKTYASQMNIATSFEGTTLREWSEFMKDEPAFAGNYGVYFAQNYSEEVAIINALARHASEIKLDRITKGAEPEKTQNIEKIAPMKTKQEYEPEH